VIQQPCAGNNRQEFRRSSPAHGADLRKHDMHWEFCNGTWAAQNGDNVYGITLNKYGEFIPVLPDGTQGEPCVFLDHAKAFFKTIDEVALFKRLAAPLLAAVDAMPVEELLMMCDVYNECSKLVYRAVLDRRSNIQNTTEAAGL
jgi:hypothetical protein